jgi:hypothetical protein
MNPRQRRWLANQTLEKELVKPEEATVDYIQVVDDDILDIEWTVTTGDVEVPETETNTFTAVEPSIDFNSMKWKELKHLGKKWKIKNLHMIKKTALLEALEKKAVKIGYEKATRDINVIETSARQLL